MKKIIGILLMFLMCVSIFSTTNAYIDKSLDISVYVNDEKLDVNVFANDENNYEGYYLDSYVPLRAVAEKMGLNVRWQAPNTIYITGSKRPVIKAEIDKSSLYYTKYVNDTLQNPFSFGYCQYYIKSGSTYVVFNELAEMIDAEIVQRHNNIYIYTGEYYYKNCAVNNYVGHKIDIDVYVNDEKIDTPVYKNLNSSDISGPDNFSDFVQLDAVFEKLGADIKWEGSDTVYITSETIGNFKIIVGGNIYEYSDSSFSDKALKATYDKEKTYKIDGKAFIPFSTIRYIIGGSLKQEDYNSMYLYSADFERNDIPATLEECYTALDKELEQQLKDDIKKSSVDDLIEYHFSLGLWIRNNWIYPSKDRVAKVFLAKGINHPDNMSGYIIEGYHNYLNGLPSDIDALISK